jgi:ParB-like chromosome segregation protein Spo0J
MIIAEMLGINEILPNPTNPNSMTETEMEQLRYSIRRFGYIQPVVVDEKNVIIDGEHRWRANKAEGAKELEVIRLSGLTNAEKMLIRQAMNKIHGHHNPLKDARELADLYENELKEELKRLLNFDEQDYEAQKIVLESPEAQESDFMGSATWRLVLSFRPDDRKSIEKRLSEKEGNTVEEKVLNWLGVDE